MRQFLVENRSNMVGAFKRYQGVGGRDLPGAQNLLRGVVKSYVALVSMADFVEVNSTLQYLNIMAILGADKFLQFEEPEPIARSYTNGFT